MGFIGLCPPTINWLWGNTPCDILSAGTPLNIFFFPNFLATHTDKGGEPDFVAKEIIGRSTGETTQE